MHHGLWKGSKGREVNRTVGREVKELATLGLSEAAVREVVGSNPMAAVSRIGSLYPGGVPYGSLLSESGSPLQGKQKYN